MARFSPVVVDHFTDPATPVSSTGADVRAFVGNPVCGDQILLTATLDRRHRDRPEVPGVRLLRLAGRGEPAHHGPRGTPDSTRRQGSTPSDVNELTGGLVPDQRHVAALAADVAAGLPTTSGTE